MAKPIKRYPKMIQKDGEAPIVVNTPYEHMAYYDRGWSGPPEFDTSISDLEAEIAKDEVELEEKRKRLDYMLAADSRSKPQEEEEKKVETPSSHSPSVRKK
jgi:hypothetical protein